MAENSGTDANMNRPSAADLPSEGEPVESQRLADLVTFEYRVLVIGRLGVTAEWRGLTWVSSAACSGEPAITREVCGRCPVVAECLAASIVSDDRAEWRAGLSRAEREQLWVGLERTYRDLRDFELMRHGFDLPVSRLQPGNLRAAVNGGGLRP